MDRKREHGTSPLARVIGVGRQQQQEPYSLHNSKHTKYTYATRVQNTTLYSDGPPHIKQHRSKEVQPNGSPARTITVALDMSKAIDTTNIYTLIRKLLQANIPGTLINLIDTISRDAKPIQHTETIQHQFKTGVPHGSVLSPTLFNIYTADLSPVHVTDLKINNTALPMATHPNGLGLTLDPKLTFSTYIHNISV